MWYDIYECLSEERQLDVSLSNPFKTRAIASANIKTDKLYALKLADLLRGGYSLDLEIKKVSKEIQSRAEKEDVTMPLLTIPGIGYYSALLILSEIGDITRFPDSYHLCSYAGLVPATHGSRHNIPWCHNQDWK